MNLNLDTTRSLGSLIHLVRELRVSLGWLIDSSCQISIIRIYRITACLLLFHLPRIFKTLRMTSVFIRCHNTSFLIYHQNLFSLRWIYWCYFSFWRYSVPIWLTYLWVYFVYILLIDMYESGYRVLLWYLSIVSVYFASTCT